MRQFSIPVSHTTWQRRQPLIARSAGSKAAVIGFGSGSFFADFYELTVPLVAARVAIVSLRSLSPESSVLRHSHALVYDSATTTLSTEQSGISLYNVVCPNIERVVTPAVA